MAPRRLKVGGGAAVDALMRRLGISAIYVDSAKNKLAWYDSPIVAGALEAQCDVLYSEGFEPHRVIESLRLENPLV